MSRGGPRDAHAFAVRLHVLEDGGRGLCQQGELNLLRGIDTEREVESSHERDEVSDPKDARKQPHDRRDRNVGTRVEDVIGDRYAEENQPLVGMNFVKIGCLSSS